MLSVPVAPFVKQNSNILIRKRAVKLRVCRRNAGEVVLAYSLFSVTPHRRRRIVGRLYVDSTATGEIRDDMGYHTQELEM